TCFIPANLRETVQTPTAVRYKIQVAPIPRNINPNHHPDRRKARAEAGSVGYTDAAMYPDRRAAALGKISQETDSIIIATVRTNLPVVAEELAIALAITSPANNTQLIILSDSQAAIGRFRAGIISPQALQILQDPLYRTLSWFEPLSRVSCLDTPSRLRRWKSSINRAPSDRAEELVPVPNQLSEILAHHRGLRYHFPPHSWLSISRGGYVLEADTWEAALLNSTAQDQCDLEYRARKVEEDTDSLDEGYTRTQACTEVSSRCKERGLKTRIY
ncbi:hypothetical protein HPB47_027655, partial [Ixodes persulcatus]